MRIAWRHLPPFALLAALALATVGCGPSLDTYYPLQVGSQWEYRTTYARSGRVETDVDTITAKRNAVYEFADGRRLVRLTHSVAEETGVDLLRSPIRPGMVWRLGGVEVEITAADRTVTVPAGTYTNCVEVTWRSVIDDKPRRTVTFYAPEVGPVLVEYSSVPESGAPELLMRSELTRYTPVKEG